MFLTHCWVGCVYRRVRRRKVIFLPKTKPMKSATNSNSGSFIVLHNILIIFARVDNLTTCR